MTYSFCKSCGAPHDDGTKDFCFDCLENFNCSDCIYGSLTANHDENYCFYKCTNKDSIYCGDSGYFCDKFSSKILEEKKEAPADREHSELICSSIKITGTCDFNKIVFVSCPDCGSDHLTELVPGEYNDLLCLGCGRIFEGFEFNHHTYHRLAHCNNCDYSYSFDDSPDSFFCGCKKSDNYELLVAESDHQLLSPCIFHKWYCRALFKGLPF